MEKDKALEAALGQIERAFGKGSIMRLGKIPMLTLKQFPPVRSALILHLVSVVCQKAAL